MNKPQPDYSVSLNAMDAVRWLIQEGYIPAIPDPLDDLMDYFEVSNGSNIRVARATLGYLLNDRVKMATQAIFDHFIAPDFDGPVLLRFSW